jgi:hypothetical protein
VADAVEAGQMADRMFHELNFLSLSIRLHKAYANRHEALAVLDEIERASRPG